MRQRAAETARELRLFGEPEDGWILRLEDQRMLRGPAPAPSPAPAAGEREEKKPAAAGPAPPDLMTLLADR